MLQFIFTIHWRHLQVSLFQYISCCSLSSWSIQKKRRSQVSIHLMLQFITSFSLHNSDRIQFQYISCCSLSPLLFNLYSRNSCFNTSHVVVYRYSGSSGLFPLCSFNTSHVVVYPTGSSSSDTYYTCFNTSHVVVYQPDNAIIIPLTSFQYISCCSLSR